MASVPEILNNVWNSATAALSSAASNVNWNPTYSPYFKDAVGGFLPVTSTEGVTNTPTAVTSTQAASQNIDFTRLAVMAGAAYLIYRAVR